MFRLKTRKLLAVIIHVKHIKQKNRVVLLFNSVCHVNYYIEYQTHGIYVSMICILCFQIHIVSNRLCLVLSKTQVIRVGISCFKIIVDKMIRCKKYVIQHRF